MANQIKYKNNQHKNVSRGINNDQDLIIYNMKLQLKSSITLQINLQVQLRKLNILEYDPITTYTKIEDIFTSTAIQTIVKYTKKKQPWIITDILNLCDKRRTFTTTDAKHIEK